MSWRTITGHLDGSTRTETIIGGESKHEVAVRLGDGQTIWLPLKKGERRPDRVIVTISAQGG